MRQPGAGPRPRRRRARRRLRRGPGHLLPDLRRRRLWPQARDDGDRAGGEPGRADAPAGPAHLVAAAGDPARHLPAGRAGADDRLDEAGADRGLAGADRGAGTAVEVARADRRRRRRWPAPAAPPSPARCRLTPSPTSAIDHAAADLGIETGLWRGAAHSYTCYFTECFIDELARAAGARAARLPHLPARRTIRASAAASPPPPRSAAGTAARRAAAWGWPATAPSARTSPAWSRSRSSGDQRLRVLRAVAAVDCGRVINPEIVKQQIEGGIVHGVVGRDRPAGRDRRRAAGGADDRRLRPAASCATRPRSASS